MSERSRSLGLLVFLAIVCALAALSLTWSNTVEGAGKDFETVEESIQEAAD